MPFPRRAAALAIAALFASGACGPKKRRPPTTSRQPVPVRPGDTESGIASWYGHPYHGRRAANGEIYDMEEMTAAHRTLPFETWVRVENLSNRKQVEVRITDRGPFIEGRIIDLSRAAARSIDMIGPGTAQVRVVVLRAPTSPAQGAFAVQVGAFRDRGNAERLRDSMQKRYGTARLVERPGNPQLWRVLVGSAGTEQIALELLGRIRSEGNEISSGFVVRIDSP